MSDRGWKNTKRASEAGRKAGIRRTEAAIGRLIRKSKSGEEITMKDSKNYAKFHMNAFGMELADDWFYKRVRSEKYKKFKDIRK